MAPSLTRAPHLVVEVARGLLGTERPELRASVERVTDLELAHPGDELGRELVCHRVDDDEPLGRHAALPRVVHATHIGPLDGLADVCIVEDDEGVAAAELKH